MPPDQETRHKEAEEPERYHPSIIPFPRAIERHAGKTILSPGAAIVHPTDVPELEPVARHLRVWLANQATQQIQAGTCAEIGLAIDPILSTEAYRLIATSERITIRGGSAAGVFYGIQTLMQMVRPWTEKQTDLSFPCVEIQDAPAFSYRGMHLDVVRHFFSVTFIKEYIDLLARYKMNRFHWHLTDDQGWRIEIKQYPRLQEVAAFRKETIIGHLNDRPQRYDGQPYGGFYTQDEIREIIDYASDRFVTVIPEIEMPGHAQAAIAAYPEFGCLGNQPEVASKWGIFEDVFCPSQETFDFLENVLREVMGLFPARYIHIGGDECPKVQWKMNPLCQEIIRRNNLKDENGLQSYFIRRIERFLNDNGRKLIGWDEILEGGLAPHATVMSWRGEKGGIEAARLGHDVIMTPARRCYFDAYQADPHGEPLAIANLVTLEDVFHYSPVPNSLTPEEARHILGAQGNVWTEYIKKPEDVEYMVFPRLQALAEVVWTCGSERDFDDFKQRARRHMVWLSRNGVNVARHLLDG
jgi:hexosaminidase